MAVMWYKKDKVNRFNDGATSIGAGQYSRLPMQVFQTIWQLVIYAGVLVHVFYSQTIRVGIKYADAWFITLKI